MRRRLAGAGEDAFTLIELLIVIIILGVLAAVVIFGVSTFKGDAVEKACKSDRKQVDTAASSYLLKNGTTAASTAALVAAGLLRSYPNAPDYQITYVQTSSQAYTVGFTGTSSC